jgi:hypothetical protein
VGHVRRFFYIDTMLSRSSASSSDGAPQAVVFPSQMSLLVTIQPDQRNRIRPPLLTLKWVTKPLCESVAFLCVGT